MISTILQIIRLLGVLRTESIKLKGRGPRKTLRKAGKAEIERGDFRFRANVNKSPEVRQSRDYSGNIRVQFDQTIENGWRNSSERQFCHVRRNSKGQVSESSTLCPLLHCPLSGSSAKLMSLNGYLKGYSYPKVSILIIKVYSSFYSYYFLIVNQWWEEEKMSIVFMARQNYHQLHIIFTLSSLKIRNAFGASTTQ